MNHKDKQKLIDDFLAKPMKVGDGVSVRGYGSKDKVNSWGYTTIAEIHGDKIRVNEYGYKDRNWIEPENYRRWIGDIGENPFTPKIRQQSYQSDIEQIIWRAGYDTDGTERKRDYFDGKVPECCFDPIIEQGGKETPYQRELVWTLYQKQLLLESIYNNIDIGKFVFRCRAWNWIEQRVTENKLEHTAFKDLVDGKQRITTLLSFIQDEFADLSGRYFSSFSDAAQRQLLGYHNVVYVELPDETTDEQTLQTFLAINHLGVPQSEEHINFVKSLL